jgi:hypothetical protein
MTTPMAVLASACLGLGLCPSAIIPALVAAQGAWLGTPADAALLSATLLLPVRAFLILGAALAAAALCLAALKERAARRVSTWDCGFATPTPRMQYTSGSFGEEVTAVLPGFLAPASVAQRPAGVFPGAASFRTDAADPIGARFFEPVAARWADRLVRLHRLQSGHLTLYLVYVFLTTLVTLAWSVLRPFVR